MYSVVVLVATETLCVINLGVKMRRKYIIIKRTLNTCDRMIMRLN